LSYPHFTVLVHADDAGWFDITVAHQQEAKK
jgi:hypothetical protein